MILWGSKDKNMDIKDKSPAELAELIDTSGYTLGICTGLEQAAGFLLKESGELFKHNQDKLANQLREFSTKIAKLADKQRKLYDEEFQPGRNECYKELEKAAWK